MPEVGAESAVAASRTVQGLCGRLHVRDYPGQEPAFVMMHGFPDDSRIYDRLAPLLAPRRVVAVDWLGYGRSERSEPAPFHDEQHRHQLRAVLDSLKLGRVALVGHDASGPDAIGYALADPGRGTRLAFPLDRAAALVAGMVQSAPAPTAASPDQLGRGRLRPAPLHP